MLILTISDPRPATRSRWAVVTAGIEALSTAESDDEIRAIVLRGNGRTSAPAATCRGADGTPPGRRRGQARMLERLHQWVEALRACPKPVIAAVEGAAPVPASRWPWPAT